MTSESSRIFISYHREDTTADAGRLADALERELGPDCVFQDVSAIELGANWERVVDQTLANAVALLLVVGPAWVPGAYRVQSSPTKRRTRWEL